MTNDILQEIEELHDQLIEAKDLVEKLENKINNKVSTLDNHPLVNIIRQEEKKKAEKLLESKEYTLES